MVHGLSLEKGLPALRGLSPKTQRLWVSPTSALWWRKTVYSLKSELFLHNVFFIHLIECKVFFFNVHFAQLCIRTTLMNDITEYSQDIRRR